MALTMMNDDKLLRSRIVRLAGPIEDGNANDVIARLLFLQQTSADKPITLRIDSPGGSVSAGLAILDTIEMLRCPVLTHCERAAQAVALVILACGHRGNRTSQFDSLLSFAMPKPIESDRSDLDLRAQRFGAILVVKVVAGTGLPEAEVQRYFEQENFFSPHEAQRLGIIDRVT